jgi:hypothetical protein
VKGEGWKEEDRQIHYAYSRASNTSDSLHSLQVSRLESHTTGLTQKPTAGCHQNFPEFVECGGEWSNKEFVFPHNLLRDC